MKKPHVYEETYQNYLSQLGELDFKEIEHRLNVQIDGGDVIIPFFGRPYRVSNERISDPSGKRPHLSVSVILCKYLLMCPSSELPRGGWVTYKDFNDAAPLIHAFFNTVTRPIAETFSGRMAALENAGKKIGGRAPADEFPYDLQLQFDALPRVPLLLLFNDKDEEFPAQCTVLFEKRTETYLDMECVAMLGMLFFDYLKTAVN